MPRARSARPLAAYDFSAAIDGLYHFVWDEFCDWYLEIVKPRLYGDDAAAAAAAGGHAMYVLDGVVRLLHPFLPFVTEEIASHYGAAPLLGRDYVVAGPDDVRPRDEAAIEQLQAAVQALRVYRAEHRFSPAETLAATFVADSVSTAGAVAAGAIDSDAALYASFSDAFRGLARIEMSAGDDPSPAPASGPTSGEADQAADNVVLVPGGRFEVAAPRVDPGEERARLRVQLDRLEAEVRRAESKLANRGFVERAPQAVVDKEKAKLAGYLADRDELAARLAGLS